MGRRTVSSRSRKMATVVRMDGDGSSGGLGGESGEYPARPTNWMSPYLITYCLIGRPSDSEDPDLRTARVTSGPRNRLGKRKAGLRATTSSSSSNEESETDSGEVGTGGNLDSTAIRTFAGAGEAQSRAKVKKETAAVHANVAQEKFRQQRMGQTEKLVEAVQTLSDAVVAKQRLDEEAAGRAREMAAEQRRATKIKNLKGEYELSDPESAEYFALRAALRFTFRQPLTDFLDNPASAATTPASGAGGASPPTSGVALSAAAMPALAAMPGFSMVGGDGAASSAVGTGEVAI
ncbi:unnamed protein product [Pylaiella littoralis]